MDGWILWMDEGMDTSIVVIEFDTPDFLLSVVVKVNEGRLMTRDDDIGRGGVWGRRRCIDREDNDDV
jgi:hypothetical protein